jgi:hypothetical protein
MVMIAGVLSRRLLIITIEQHLTFETRPIKMLEEEDRVMRHQTFLYTNERRRKQHGFLNEGY